MVFYVRTSRGNSQVCVFVSTLKFLICHYLFTFRGHIKDGNLQIREGREKHPVGLFCSLKPAGQSAKGLAGFVNSVVSGE